ncbi:sensor histidine kinase [Paenibacillus cymbidii]|uniref:sensor histidine kinase n=1 Tax=Paenibacillus cymbidii TaxID=1639034 RepID=UPI001436C07E|nr:sensor histidine kinase [Paenibacillus cymbidii]
MVVSLIVLAAACPQLGFAKPRSDEVQINQWRMQWINEGTSPDQPPAFTDDWFAVEVGKPVTSLPSGYNGAWVRITVPPTQNWLTPGLLINYMYGLDIGVYEDDRLIYRSTRDFDFDRNMLLVSLASRSTPSDLYIHIRSIDRAGLSGIVRVGDLHTLSESYMREEVPSLLLGAAIAFLGLLMLLISGYLNAQQRGPWIALSLIALTISILITTYSTLMYIIFAKYGNLLLFLFDASMLVLFPSLHFYVASIFRGKLVFFKRFGRWFAGYAAFCLLILVLNQLIGDSFFFFYRLFTYWLLAPFILVHLLMVLIVSVVQATRGNRNSMILAAGFLALAGSGVADLMLLYVNKATKVPFLWKIGVVLLIGSLVITLARRISADYRKLSSYAKELELYNHQVQRAEKMKFVSDLAASIAHEVRNPLQVTRGFLQLMAGKSDEASQSYFNIAVNELDRASTIITDFLTFAKPEMDTIVTIDICQEMTHIHTIISPMAAYQGANISVLKMENLYVRGNPSKFKQAFMNIIKNSIEASRENGTIEWSVYADNDTAVIRISDNGEGMDYDQIAKLGEPYYSTKTKGTGLGLMVTFRIIEVMNGTLEFRSEKGKGTEAIARFPLVRHNQAQT